MHCSQSNVIVQEREQRDLSDNASVGLGSRPPRRRQAWEWGLRWCHRSSKFLATAETPSLSLKRRTGRHKFLSRRIQRSRLQLRQRHRH